MVSRWTFRSSAHFARKRCDTSAVMSPPNPPISIRASVAPSEEIVPVLRSTHTVSSATKKACQNGKPEDATSDSRPRR